MPDVLLIALGGDVDAGTDNSLQMCVRIEMGSYAAARHSSVESSTPCRPYTSRASSNEELSVSTINPSKSKIRALKREESELSAAY